MDNLIQWIYCVHTCFYIVLVFEKYLHVITAVINFCDYIPHLTLTLPLSHLNSSDVFYNTT